MLLLVACQQAAPPAEVNQAEPANEAAAAPADDASPTAPTSAIPAEFHGIYDRDAAGCAARSEQRLEVSADALRFHESIGTVTAVTREGEDALSVVADFEGEGERWSNVLRLALGAGGTLTVTQHDGARLTRVRCR